MTKKEGKPALLLLCLGISASILDFSVEQFASLLNDARQYLMKWSGNDDTVLHSWITWTSFSLVVCLASIAWTKLVDPVAAGSGIPEMKAIISWDLRQEADRYLRARTLLAKSTGLALALGSGISVGREGPFVHTASIIVHRLMKNVPFFRRIYKNDVLRRHMYNAACAVGVTSTFRAPVGGVLFAIEVTSTIFMVTNYWRAFIAACSAAITRQVIRLLRDTSTISYKPWFPTDFSIHSFSHVEYVSFAILGALMGFAGALYVQCTRVFRRKWRKWSDKRQIASSAVLIVAISAVLTLPCEVGQVPFTTVAKELFSTGNLTEKRWTQYHGSLFLSLPIAALCRLLATIWSTSLPLPAGDFIPTFVSGAILGRLYGEVLAVCFPGRPILPGGYALVGASAFVGASTHTLSAAIIGLEFTGQFVYLLPLLVAGLFATAISSALSVSIYDAAIIGKGLRYLPMLRVNELEDARARDIMAIDFPVATHTMTLNALRCLLTQDSERHIPVVDCLENMGFDGCIPRTVLERVVATTDSSSQLSIQTSPLALAQIFDSDDTKARSQHVAITIDGDFEGSKIANVRARDQSWSSSASTDSSEDSDSSVPGDEPTGDELIHLKTYMQFHHLLDSSVLQVDTETPLQKVHLLFEMVKCHRLWVTRRGRLIGLIRRKDLYCSVQDLRRQRADLGRGNSTTGT